ncbi:alpha-L-fucosidase, partial [Acinetobacter baumannii]
SASLIHDLVDIVSKNGALLLNIGPKSDGTIPDEDQRILREIGDWLTINGEAIYGTRPWKAFGEGPTKVKSGSFTDTNREPFTS